MNGTTDPLCGIFNIFSPFAEKCLSVIYITIFPVRYRNVRGILAKVFRIINLAYLILFNELEKL